MSYELVCLRYLFEKSLYVRGICFIRTYHSFVESGIFIEHFAEAKPNNVTEIIVKCDDIILTAKQ